VSVAVVLGRNDAGTTKRWAPHFAERPRFEFVVVVAGHEVDGTDPARCWLPSASGRETNMNVTTGTMRWVVCATAAVMLAGCGDTDSFGENACNVYDRIEADQSVLTDAQLVEQAQRMELLASESESVALQSAARAFAEDIVAGRDAAPASADVVAACNALRG
jgi:hypothetical protein